MTDTLGVLAVSRTRCTLDEPRVRATLARLFREKRRQRWRVAKHVVRTIGERLRGYRPTLAAEVQNLSGFYASVSERQGELLYLIARSTHATRIVEYGTSVGMSTIYLASAVRDNGGGTVIGTELHSAKHAAAVRNLTQAGLLDVASVRLGDALQTLRDPGGTVDMVFLDGYPALYLEILMMLIPHLRAGSVIVADNILTHRAMLRDYLAFVRDSANGFRSATLPLKYGTEYTVRI